MSKESVNIQYCNYTMMKKTQGKHKEPQSTAAFPFKCAFGSTAVHIVSGNPAQFTIIATAAIIVVKALSVV